MHKFEMPQQHIDTVIERQGRAHTCETLDGTRTALLVVDMQFYFVDDGPKALFPVAVEIMPNINKLAKAVRSAGGLVIWIQTLAPKPGFEHQWWTSHERLTPERLKKRIYGLAKGAKDYELRPELEIEPEDGVVIKRRYSAFIQDSSDIEIVLRDRGIDTVLVTGTATNVCCESTARDAMMRNYRTLMVSDGNAAATDAQHAATLISFYLHFGDVRSTDELVSMLRPNQTPSVAAQ